MTIGGERVLSRQSTIPIIIPNVRVPTRTAIEPVISLHRRPTTAGVTSLMHGRCGTALQAGGDAQSVPPRRIFSFEEVGACAGGRVA